MEFWLQVISALASLGLASIWYQWSAEFRQRRSDNFNKYALRYQEILSQIVKIGPLDRTFDSQSPEDRFLVMRLFMLFSEEYYLVTEQKLIDPKAWNVWKASIEHSVQNFEYFHEAWKFCRTQMDLEGDFSDFIDEMIAKGVNREICIKRRAA